MSSTRETWKLYFLTNSICFRQPLSYIQRIDNGIQIWRETLGFSMKILVRKRIAPIFKAPLCSERRNPATMKTLLWLLFLVAIFQISVSETTGRCHSLEYSVSGMFLRGHTFKTTKVWLPEECYFKCQDEVTCQSYNYVISEKVCELNNRTREARPADFLPDWRRFYIKRLSDRVLLGSTQELPAESCSEIEASEGQERADGDFWIYSDGTDNIIKAHCKGNWQKLNTDSVCFGARDNQHGSFHVEKSGQIKKMKLIHRSGSIRCNQNDLPSYWGCRYSKYGSNDFMTIITNGNRKSRLPPSENLMAFPTGTSHDCGTKKHFYNPGGAGHNSQELIFNHLVRPLSVSRNEEFQIWYGQDWIDCSEDGNTGQTCVDVFAWYV